MFISIQVSQVIMLRKNFLKAPKIIPEIPNLINIRILSVCPKEKKSCLMHTK